MSNRNTDISSLHHRCFRARRNCCDSSEKKGEDSDELHFEGCVIKDVKMEVKWWKVRRRFYGMGKVVEGEENWCWWLEETPLLRVRLYFLEHKSKNISQQASFIRPRLLGCSWEMGWMLFVLWVSFNLDPSGESPEPLLDLRLHSCGPFSIRILLLSTSLTDFFKHLETDHLSSVRFVFVWFYFLYSSWYCPLPGKENLLLRRITLKWREPIFSSLIEERRSYHTSPLILEGFK